MKLIEKRICVDKEGSLMLPTELVSAAAFDPGTELNVTLAISENGLLPCPLMIVTTDAPVTFTFDPDCGGDEEPEDGELEDGELEDSEAEDDFMLPHELLNAAGIPIDSDLDVTCVPGSIIIKGSDILDRLPDGLRTLFCSFGIRPEIVREVMKKEGYFV